MGTRNLVAVQKDGVYKIAQYAQWDGYPSGQGVGVLSFLQSEENVKKLIESLIKVRFIDDEKDKEFMESYDKNAPKWSNEPDNRTDEQKKWFTSYMSRDLGSDILINVAESKDEEIILRNSIGFAGDSLFCEYAYVVDFDKNVFEVYKGFNKEPLSEKERFSNVEGLEESKEYTPIKLWESFDISNLPTKEEFLAKLSEDDDEDED